LGDLQASVKHVTLPKVIPLQLFDGFLSVG
jgi:hypothetical protein